MRLATLVAALCLTGLPSLAQPQTQLRLGHSQSETSAFQTGAQALAVDFERRTNGRYKVLIFPAGALGGERELIASAQNGSLDLVLTSTGPVGHFVPDTLLTDIPFLFRDSEHARKVLDGPIGQDLLTRFPAQGLVALAWGENGFRHLTNNKRPVSKPEDLRGLKIRTMENPVHITAFKVLGAQAAPMSFTDLYTALRVGTIDGQENPLPTILSSGFGPLQRYLSLTGHVYSPALFIAAPASFSRLSESDRRALVEAARVGATAMRKRVTEVEAQALEALKQEGVIVESEIDKARFQAALAPAYTDYAKRFGNQTLERIRNYR